MTHDKSDLVSPSGWIRHDDAQAEIARLTAVPAQPVQEPVAWLAEVHNKYQTRGGYDERIDVDEWRQTVMLNEPQGPRYRNIRPLYAHPATPAPVEAGLMWEDLGADYWRAPAPLFGSIRIDPWGDRGFQVLWSVPGICDRLIADLFPTVEAAKAAAQAAVHDAIAALRQQPAPQSDEAATLRAELAAATAERDALEVEVAMLREALTKINVGDGWAAQIARAALRKEGDA